MSTSWERMVWRWGVGGGWNGRGSDLWSCELPPPGPWAVAINWAQTLQLGSIKGQLGILSHFGQFGVFQSNCSFPPFLTLNFAFSICICFCGLTVWYCTSKLVKSNPSAESKWFWKQLYNLAFLFSFVSTKFSWLYADNKHRKNCECCPGHYLIVNHYSSI